MDFKLFKMLSNVFILLVGLRPKIFLILNFNFFSIRRNFDGGGGSEAKNHISDALSDHLKNIGTEKYGPSAFKCRVARIFPNPG